MDTTSLMIPRGNDVVVTARFPEIATGTGMSSQFWYKNDKTTPDSDPSVLMVQSTVVSDPDFPGATKSTFALTAANNAATGAFWWRVDVIDTSNKRRTANCGTLLVEAV
jgi:hypothetical protein